VNEKEKKALLEKFKKKKAQPKRHKFGAKRCESDGIKFPSKLEARYYNHLKFLQKQGDVVFFLRQVPFYLPGEVKYVVDFQVFWANGIVTFVDTKGKDTAMSIAKRKMVEDLYPVEIEIVTKV
jgi:hypothetical protein